MEHFTKILPNGSFQIPSSMLKDLGFEPGTPIKLNAVSGFLEVHSAKNEQKKKISFGCMKNEIIMHDDLISPINIDWYA